MSIELTRLVVGGSTIFPAFFPFAIGVRLVIKGFSFFSITFFAVGVKLVFFSTTFGGISIVGFSLVIILIGFVSITGCLKDKSIFFLIVSRIDDTGG